MDDPVGFGNLLAGIAQNGIVEFEFFGKTRIGLFVIAAGGEVCDVEFP